MTTMLTVSVAVPVIRASADQAAIPGLQRVAGVGDDGQTVVVATMHQGEKAAQTELRFQLCEAVRLAELCLAGDRRALTAPGLARILSATALLLFRVSATAGAIQAIENPHDGNAGYLDDQQEASGDEDPGE